MLIIIVGAQEIGKHYNYLKQNLRCASQRVVVQVDDGDVVLGLHPIANDGARVARMEGEVGRSAGLQKSIVIPQLKQNCFNSLIVNR